MKPGLTMYASPTNFNRQRQRAATALVATHVVTAILGCSASFGPSVMPVTPLDATVTGHVYGAGQPVTAATVTLYAAGTSGNGMGAFALLSGQTSVTDSSGLFSIAESFTCPSAATQTYLVARGGISGATSSTANPAIVLIAALGDCGSLTTANYVLNEVTTAAAAWALAPFFGTDANIGASVTNATALRNSFALAANLANTLTGVSPGENFPAAAKLETAKINTLANALVGCTRSAVSPSCGALLAASTPGSATPTTTLQAALNIIRNPAANIAAVYTASAMQTTFTPALNTAPHDWTLSVTYGNCISGCGGLSTPGSVAIDSSGSVLVANYAGGAISKFSSTGATAAVNGVHGTGLYASYGITVDASDNAWVTNEQSYTVANRYSGSISKFSSSGAELSGQGYTGGGIYYPLSIAATSTGSIWVADYGSSSASLLASDGTAISGASGYAASQLPFTSAIAVDGSQNAWFTSQKGIARVTPLGAVTLFSCCTDPEGIAVDPSGNIWVADYGAFSIVELSSAGQLLATVSTASTNASPKGIAIDSAGTVWAANYFGNSITALTANAAGLRSPTAGLGLDAPLHEPYGTAVDSSGNVWVSNSGNNTLTEFVGLAAPVRTPLLGPPAQP
jgi:streptogramin lyase